MKRLCNFVVFINETLITSSTFIGRFSPSIPLPVSANYMLEYINIESNPDTIQIFEKIEDAEDWRLECINNAKEFNNWLDRYLVWVAKKLKKEGKSDAFIEGYADQSVTMYKRNHEGCDCFMRQRRFSLSALSKKTADAKVDAQVAKCFTD